MSGAADDGTVSYNYSQCQNIYEELVQDQATISAQMAYLKETIDRLMGTWTGISASAWQDIQLQWKAATDTMLGDLNKMANYLPEATGNMKYADKQAAERIASIM